MFKTAYFVCGKHYIYIYIYISGGPLSALTCCVNSETLIGDKKNIAVNLFSKLGWELYVYLCALRITTKRCAFKQTGCALGLM